MSKFKYKFENIKRIKKTFEKEVQRQIQIIDKEIVRLNEYKSDLIREREDEKRKVFSKAFVNANELHFYSNIEKLIEEKVEITIEKINELNEAKKKKIQELLQKSKERKIFEKLEENHFEVYKFNQNKFEQKEIDDFANKKFIKNS